MLGQGVFIGGMRGGGRWLLSLRMRLDTKCDTSGYYPELFFITCELRLLIGTRRQFTHLAQPRPIHQEQDRDGNHEHGYASQQRPSPLDAQVIEHLPSKEREARAHHGAHHRVCGKGRSGTTPLARISTQSGNIQIQV